MKGPWTDRLKLIERALGWPRLRLAQELGFVKANPVDRIVNGGIPSVETLLRIQAVERLYAEQIEHWRGRNGGRRTKAVLFPPASIECRQRWWVGGVQHVATARSADLAALGAAGPDAPALSRRTDPRNFPGRVLKIVDWTAEGRAQFTKDRQARSRSRFKVVEWRPAKVDAANTGGEKQ